MIDKKLRLKSITTNKLFGTNNVQSVLVIFAQMLETMAEPARSFARIFRILIELPFTSQKEMYADQKLTSNKNCKVW